MLQISGEQIAMLVAAGIASIFVGKWWFTKDTEAENRRRLLNKVVGKTREYGLQEIPDFLEDLVVADYSSAISKMVDLGKRLMKSDTALIEELDKAFDRILTQKLATEAGRLFLAARIAESSPQPTKEHVDALTENQ